MKNRELFVGQTVTDELTGDTVRILEVHKTDTATEYCVDSVYLDGWRYSWEISEALVDTTLSDEDIALLRGVFRVSLGGLDERDRYHALIGLAKIIERVDPDGPKLLKEGV